MRRADSNPRALAQAGVRRATCGASGEGPVCTDCVESGASEGTLEHPAAQLGEGIVPAVSSAATSASWAEVMAAVFERLVTLHCTCCTHVGFDAAIFCKVGDCSACGSSCASAAGTIARAPYVLTAAASAQWCSSSRAGAGPRGAIAAWRHRHRGCWRWGNQEAANNAAATVAPITAPRRNFLLSMRSPCHDPWIIVVPFNESPGCAAALPNCYRSRRMVGETGLSAGKQPRKIPVRLHRKIIPWEEGGKLPTDRRGPVVVGLRASRGAQPRRRLSS